MSGKSNNSNQSDLNRDNYFLHKGDEYSRSKKFEESISEYNQAIGINPRNFNALNNRACSFYKLGKLDEAIKDLTAALCIRPRNTTFLFNRGTVYADQFQWDHAIRDFKLILKIKPKDNDAQLHLDKVMSDKARFIRGQDEYDAQDPEIAIKDLDKNLRAFQMKEKMYWFQRKGSVKQQEQEEQCEEKHCLKT